MCKHTKNSPIQGGCKIFTIQVEPVEDLTREGKHSGGLRPPSELCLHILCKL